MSFARIFPESVQKTCTTVTWVPYTVIFLHGDNSFAASYSAPLSFRVELGVDPVSMGCFFNSCQQLDQKSGSSIKSGMTKRILFWLTISN